MDTKIQSIDKEIKKLRVYKYGIIGAIQSLKRRTREIDKEIKHLLEKQEELQCKAL